MASYDNLFDTPREVRLSVQSRDIVLTRSLRGAVRRILSTALGRFASRIVAIHVWLEDVNGPRCGEDTRCRIDLELRPRGRICVSALAPEDYSAAAKAAVRTRELLDRRTELLPARSR